MFNMWPYKNISHIQMFLFSNPTHKIQIEIANRWDITNNKAHAPIIVINQIETKNNNQIIFIRVKSH
jgi:hypothetical protein